MRGQESSRRQPVPSRPIAGQLQSLVLLHAPCRCWSFEVTVLMSGGPSSPYRRHHRPHSARPWRSLETRTPAAASARTVPASGPGPTSSDHRVRRRETQHCLGHTYWRAGPDRDPEKAVTWFRKAAEQGHDLAQFHLGEAYATGTGGTRDLEEARRWFFQGGGAGGHDGELATERCRGLGRGRVEGAATDRPAPAPPPSPPPPPTPPGRASPGRRGRPPPPAPGPCRPRRRETPRPPARPPARGSGRTS
jgi:hypothetical protein